jgi:hypothetical protein
MVVLEKVIQSQTAQLEFITQVVVEHQVQQVLEQVVKVVEVMLDMHITEHMVVHQVLNKVNLVKRIKVVVPEEMELAT